MLDRGALLIYVPVMKLLNYIKMANVNRKQFARTLNISQGYLSKLINGQKVPSMRLAERIEEATDDAVTKSDWKVIK